MEGHKVSLAFKPLRSNLLNLPSPLCNLLYNANINIQDVIVEIVSSTGTKLYAGWSGMTSSSIDEAELDPSFARSLNFSDMANVTLNLKLDNFETILINLEPVSSSDWELVELHAQILEDKLLSQTRCVSLNQTLVVYPTQTSSARLVVTDIGTKTHQFAKISPMCEVAIAPKVRVKSSTSTKSAKSLKGKSSSGEDYSSLPSVLKRSISLPHKIYDNILPHSDSEGYEVYVNFAEVVHSLNNSKFVAVSIIPGPTTKTNTVSSGQQEKNQQQNATIPSTLSSKEKPSTQPLKENKRIIAKLVNFPSSPTNTVGLSQKLAIALGCELQLGNIVVLQPTVLPVSKKPSSLTIHPYITQTKKNNALNLNSTSKKDQDFKTLEGISKYLSLDILSNATPITNNCKIPIIPGYLPHGGLMKFKRNDDANAWIRPSADSKLPRLELGEDLLRNESFLQQVNKDESDANELAVGMEKMQTEILDVISTTKNSGTLIFGNSGSGKSLLLKLISQEVRDTYGYHVKFAQCETIMNENFQLLSNNHILKWLQECSWHKPSLLVLDNVDKILSAELEHTDSTQSNQLAEFLISQIQKIHSQRESNLSILLSASSKESLNKLLFQSHLLEHFHHLSAPIKSTRLELLNYYLVEKLGCLVDFDIMDIVSETEGYLPNDLKILGDRIYHESLFSRDDSAGFKGLHLTKEAFESAIKGYTPSNLRGVKLQKSTVSWSDIGGLLEAKNILLETLEWPTKYAPIFANCPLRLRSGILLYGYPGCGKTLLASAIAGQCGLNFISIKGPEILNKYIGASEQSVRELFERAQSAKPCILFFDEFDSIAPKRGHDSTGVTDRVVNQMLTQMDGAEGLDGVYVLAATSRPDLIDSALLRPGRLDKSVICDMPNYEDRLDILRTITKKMDLSDDVNLEELAHRTNGFSGADMQGLGYNAYLKAVHVKLENDEKEASNTEVDSSKASDNYEFFHVNSEKLRSRKLRPADRVQLLQQIKTLFDSNETTDSKTKEIVSTAPVVYIRQEDFEESLKETKPSISASEMKKLSGIYNQFVSGRDGNMPDGTPSSEIGGRTTLM